MNHQRRYIMPATSLGSQVEAVSFAQMNDPVAWSRVAARCQIDHSGLLHSPLIRPETALSRDETFPVIHRPETLLFASTLFGFSFPWLPLADCGS